MKVLQINTVCGNGSVGRITVDILHTLEEAGGEGFIFYGRRGKPEDIPALKIGTRPDMAAHVLCTFLKGEHGFCSDGQTNKLIEKIREYQPDVIQLHNIHGFYLNIEILFEFLKAAGIPIVWTLHDCWSFTGHCAYFDYAGCEKWKTQCRSCPQYKTAYPYAIFKDNSENNYTRKKAAFTKVPDLTIVTPSEWLKGLVKESFLKDYPVKVIYNGIDLNKFQPQTEDLRARYAPNGKYMILGVANIWEKRKGLAYFDELADQLSESFQIILIGLTKKQLKEVHPKIIGITRTDHVKQLAEYYTLADVYVNVTLEDNFPTTNLEALACGTPVITFATGGSVESVDESCGIIVPKGDLQALKRAVLSMKEHPRQREACITKSKQYEKRERFMHYIELYREITQAGADHE